MVARKIVMVLLISLSFVVSAQADEKATVQKTIEEFFKGFHAQDSVQIKTTVADDIILQTVGNDGGGKAIVHTENFDAFLRHIVGIPESTAFEEKIISYNIQIDGAMAHVWTDYEFWINGKRSHCGVNSFQLVNDGSGWKIIYLIDTRRKSGC